MAAAAPVAPADLGRPTRGVQPLRAGQGHSFLWRRLHSLSGIIPIGAFLVEHIVSNFETWNGPLAYAKQVVFLNSLPLVRVLEWGLIFIPLAFHALYGVWIAFRGRVNVNVYPWASNWMYISQRVTGLIAFAYIIQHVLRQRFLGVSLPEHPGAAFAKVQHELSNPWMLAIYVIAMVATTWHFAYGIWLFAAKWGITPGDRARKRFGYICGAVGTALCVMGLVSIYAVVYKYPNAPADVMLAQPAGVTLSPSTAPPNSTNPAQPGQQSSTSNPEVVDQPSDPYTPFGGHVTHPGDQSSQLSVPMFDPSGTVRLIPAGEMPEALKAGGLPAVRVMSPGGGTSWLREKDVNDALKHGGHVVTYEAGTR